MYTLFADNYVLVMQEYKNIEYMNPGPLDV